MCKAYACFPPQSNPLHFHSIHTFHFNSPLTSCTVALPDTGATQQGPEAVGKGGWTGGWAEGYAGTSHPESQTGLPASSAQCLVRVFKNPGRINKQYFSGHVQIN